MMDHVRLRRWSLESVQFLLSHIENFVEDAGSNAKTQDLNEAKIRARDFSISTGLDKIERLIEVDPLAEESSVESETLPLLALNRLSAFFDSGLLLRRGLSEDVENWWVTDLFWRGNIFHLELKDQVRANPLVPEITPLQVHRADAKLALKQIQLDFMLTPDEANAYILRPTPAIAFVLISHLAPPFAVDHIAHAHRLVNKCFLY